METFDNENEQREAIKNFFAENGKALIIGVVLGIGALVGWRYWSNSQITSAREFSQAYDRVVSGLQAGKPQDLAAAGEFVATNRNIYGALASLSLAQKYITDNDLTKAAADLEQGLANAKDDNLNALLNIRLARIQVQQKQADAAIKTLSSVKGAGWSAIVDDLRGEALLSKGDKQGAREAWSQGVANDASPELREMMKMKINNLSS